MRFVAKLALVSIAVVSLLVFSDVRVGALPDGDECAGLRGKAANDCIRQMHQAMRQIQRELEEKKKQKEKPPVWVGEANIPRPYGYWIGDRTELFYTIELKPGVEGDFSRLADVGANVGPFIVRERTITEHVSAEGVRQVTVRYVVQNYAVLPQQQYVPFGPLEIFWRQGNRSEWKRLEVPPAKILISPISLWNEVPDAKLAPKDMMEFSHAAISWILVCLGALGMGGALVLFAKALLDMYRRYERSPLWRAARIMSRRDVTATEVITAFRAALREKFGVSGADSADEVAATIALRPFWKRFAAEAAALWEETTAVLYEEQSPGDAVVPRIRSFITALSRREVDE